MINSSFSLVTFVLSLGIAGGNESSRNTVDQDYPPTTQPPGEATASLVSRIRPQSRGPPVHRAATLSVLVERRSEDPGCAVAARGRHESALEDELRREETTEPTPASRTRRPSGW